MHASSSCVITRSKASSMVERGWPLASRVVPSYADAPAASSGSRQDRWPWYAAAITGVRPLRLGRPAAAPLRSSSATTSAWPRSHASSSGDEPSSRAASAEIGRASSGEVDVWSHTSTSSSSARAASVSPLAQALWRAWIAER